MEYIDGFQPFISYIKIQRVVILYSPDIEGWLLSKIFAVVSSAKMDLKPYY